MLYSLKVVRREICAVVTKGTLIEGEHLLANPDPSYLLSVTESHQQSSKKSQETCTIGVCIVDVSTSKFIVGQVSAYILCPFPFVLNCRKLLSN
jgi:DNA mismatch repair protein MSH6